MSNDQYRRVAEARRRESRRAFRETRELIARHFDAMSEACPDESAADQWKAVGWLIRQVREAP